MMETYSAYLEYTDAQIGRVIDAIAAKGQLDNTLIIYIVGDNGASAEGGLEEQSTASRAQRHPARPARPPGEV